MTNQERIHYLLARGVQPEYIRGLVDVESGRDVDDALTALLWALEDGNRTIQTPMADWGPLEQWARDFYGAFLAGRKLAGDILDHEMAEPNAAKESFKVRLGW